MGATTFRKLAGRISVEILKSAVLVIVSSVIGQSLRKATTDVQEHAVQTVNYVRSRIIDLKNKKAA